MSSKCEGETVHDILTGTCLDKYTKIGHNVHACQTNKMVYNRKTEKCEDLNDEKNIDIRRQFARNYKSSKKLPVDMECYRQDNNKKACNNLQYCAYSSKKKCDYIQLLEPIDVAIAVANKLGEKNPKVVYIYKKFIAYHERLSKELEEKKREIAVIKVAHQLDKSRDFDKEYMAELCEIAQYLRRSMLEIEVKLLELLNSSAFKAKDQENNLEDFYGAGDLPQVAKATPIYGNTDGRPVVKGEPVFRDILGDFNASKFFS